MSNMKKKTKTKLKIKAASATEELNGPQNKVKSY